MVKRVFVVHGWEGSPESDWFPWLKWELKKRKFIVEVPAMPDSDAPKIEAWINFLMKKVGKVDQETYFVGHSIGCQAILRYLEKLPGETQIGGCIFVAGWFSLQGLETQEEEEVAKPWLETKIDFAKIKRHTKNFVAIFSDNDPFVPYKENSKIFKEKLGAKILLEQGKEHFDGAGCVTELPVVLAEVLTMTKMK